MSSKDKNKKKKNSVKKVCAQCCHDFCDELPGGSEIDTVDLLICKWQDCYEPSIIFLLYKSSLLAYTLTTLVYMVQYVLNREHQFFLFECPQDFMVGLFLVIGYSCFTFHYLWVSIVLFWFYIKDWKPSKRNDPEVADLPILAKTDGIFLITQIIGQNLAFPIFFGYFIWNPVYDFPGLVYGCVYFIVAFLDEISNLHSAPRKWFFIPILVYGAVALSTFLKFENNSAVYNQCKADGKLDTRFLGTVFEGDAGMNIFYFLKAFEVCISFFCIIYMAAVIKNCIKPEEEEEDED